jgi:hypothetical protein
MSFLFQYMFAIFTMAIVNLRSWYSDWLWAGRRRGQSSSQYGQEFSQHRPDQRWGPRSLLSNAYQALLGGGGLKLTTHLQLVPRSRKCGSIHPLPHMPSWHSA